MKIPARFHLLLIYTLLFLVPALGQSDARRLHGRIQDSQGQVIAGATVSADETGTAVKSDERGEFTLPLPPHNPARVTFSAPGYYAQTQELDTTRLIEVEVTLTRSVLVKEEISVQAPRLQIPLAQNPAATAIVGAEVLSSLPRAVGAEEVLNPVPGVKVDNQANQERVHISMRGQGILSEHGLRGIEVLMDGLPLNDPSGFAPDLFDVDWSSIQEVAVVRGPVAFLYGGGSSAGVIEITGKTATEQKHAEFLGDGGSNGFYKGHLEYSQPLGNGSLFLSMARTSGDGYRTHTNFYGDNVYGKYSFKPTRSLTMNLMSWGTGYFNQNPEGLNIEQVREDPHQPNPDSLKYNEYQKTERGMGGATGTWTITEGQRVSFASYYRYTHYDESVPSAVDHQNMYAPGGSAQWNGDFRMGPVTHYVSAGGDLDHLSIDEYKHPNIGAGIQTPELLSDQNIIEKRVAGFLADRMAIGQKWSILGSVRRDHINNELSDYLRANGLDLSGERSFDRTTGRVGVAFTPRSDVSLYSSWGQGFLPPATEELYANPDALGGFNKHLVPATSWGVEGGLRASLREHLYFDTAVFHLKTKRDFERYRIEDRPLETFYGNAGETSRNGVEAEVRWIPVRQVSIAGAYTYSHFTYTSYASRNYPGDLSGNWLPNSPNHQVYVNGTFFLPLQFTLDVGTMAYSRAFIDPTNAAHIDGYGLLNARLIKEFRCGKYSCSVFGSGRNLTATHYIAFTEPDPDGNSYQPGPLREGFVGLRVTF